MGPRRLWSAASHPSEFFANLPEDPRPGAAVWPALQSTTVGSLVLALAMAGATSSDAWLPILLLTVPGLVLYAAILWLLGGLVLARVASLDLRGWEIAAWAWVPTGFLALSLVPVVAVFPVFGLMLGTLGLPVWHLAVVQVGLQQFAGARRRRALLIYALVVVVGPILIIGGSLLAALAGIGAAGMG